MDIESINGVRYLDSLINRQSIASTPIIENNTVIDFSFLIQKFLSDLSAITDTPELKAELNTDQSLWSAIQQISSRYGIDSSLVKAVIKQESGFNPRAVSNAGALGLMQLMPATARELGVKDPMNPVENIEGGVKYLKMLLDRFKDVKKALAAYNAGPSFVERNGVENYPSETKDYINKVLMYKSQFDKKA
ncbi:lytic transglycosylase domain-containing protein [Caldanaerobius polysaccharolyticus]|uniref:lytic transglycosylase domain-containing protein n=1 Tax=Caldanaerobius polysaccharolyticus TaxID=44256 RepID=UPI00068E6E55|nr:lytic transglycosylase domain-containing protein [Caldanaerobius polysaccharolyticus]